MGTIFNHDNIYTEQSGRGNNWAYGKDRSTRILDTDISYKDITDYRPRTKRKKASI
jgi:hypothetical protein